MSGQGNEGIQLLTSTIGTQEDNIKGISLPKTVPEEYLNVKVHSAETRVSIIECLYYIAKSILYIHAFFCLFVCLFVSSVLYMLITDVLRSNLCSLFKQILYGVREFYN